MNILKGVGELQNVQNGGIDMAKVEEGINCSEVPTRVSLASLQGQQCRNKKIRL